MPNEGPPAMANRRGLRSLLQPVQAAAQRLMGGGAPAGRSVSPATLPFDVDPRVASRYAAWNTKVMGSSIARQLYAVGRAGRAVPPRTAPQRIGLGGRLCTQKDIEAAWLHHWCERLRMVATYHRKVWEDCFAAQALWEAGMMEPGRRGLGFAVGQEPLPALLAGAGAEVLATDLAPEDDRARVWHDTGQHADAAAILFRPDLVAREEFDARVRYRPVDMTAIPDDLMQGGFDFLWSVCSLEHLGSIEAGLGFVLKAMRCLKPGGVAVHTTEYNTAETGPTVEKGPTVLFQRRHIEALAARAAAAGHEMLPMDFSTGEGVLDHFVDLPPFSEPDGALPVPDAPHLRLLLGEHVATSVGFIIRAKG